MSECFKGGIAYAAQAARMAAAQMERHEAARHPHFQVAAAVLRGYADALTDKDAKPRLLLMFQAIAASPDASGHETCPECGGRARWVKDSSNGHIHVTCVGEGCFSAMQ